MISSTFVRSGGLPAGVTAAISRKYPAPMSGVLITRARATAPWGLLKPCTDPRGVPQLRDSLHELARCLGKLEGTGR